MRGTGGWGETAPPAREDVESGVGGWGSAKQTKLAAGGWGTAS